jgi:hypothetical protein
MLDVYLRDTHLAPKLLEYDFVEAALELHAEAAAQGWRISCFKLDIAEKYLLASRTGQDMAGRMTLFGYPVATKDRVD